MVDFGLSAQKGIYENIILLILKEQSCLSVSNIRSADVRLTMVLKTGTSLVNVMKPV